MKISCSHIYLPLSIARYLYSWVNWGKMEWKKIFLTATGRLEPRSSWSTVLCSNHGTISGFILLNFFYISVEVVGSLECVIGVARNWLNTSAAVFISQMLTTVAMAIVMCLLLPLCICLSLMEYFPNLAQMPSRYGRESGCLKGSDYWEKTRTMVF